MNRRGGFTLVELLVVLGIMLVLSAIGVGAAMKAMAWSSTMTTETTLRKVQERLARRQDQIVTEARNWYSPAILRLAGGIEDRAIVLRIKLLYKWSCPMTYAEVLNNRAEALAYGYSPSGYPFGNSIMQRLQSRMSGGATLAAPAASLLEQNAACLAAIFDLTLGSSVDDLAPTELMTCADARDTNPLVKDAWGTPLFYARYGHLVNVAPILGPLSIDATRATYQTGAPFPFAFAIYGNYYSQLLDRARDAYPAKFVTDDARDLDDPTLRLDTIWAQATGTWAIGPMQNAQGFLLTFGYPLPPADPQTGMELPRIYAPLVVLSAGHDRNFATWDDNLDSYRNGVRLGKQQ